MFFSNIRQIQKLLLQNVKLFLAALISLAKLRIKTLPCDYVLHNLIIKLESTFDNIFFQTSLPNDISFKVHIDPNCKRQALYSWIQRAYLNQLPL